MQDLEVVLSVSHRVQWAMRHILTLQSYQQVPHMVQQVMSGERTPILSGAIPAFEMFMSRWENLTQDHPRLKPLIEPGLDWAYMYYGRMDHTRAYIIAMCV